jgi:hypothetical protein
MAANSQSNRCGHEALTMMLCAAVLSNVANAAESKLPKLRQGMQFDKARTLLLDAGWQGIRNYPPPENFGMLGYVFYDLGFTEVVDCAGTGMAPCIFVYKNAKGKKLEVHTYGEERLVLDTW